MNTSELTKSRRLLTLGQALFFLSISVFALGAVVDHLVVLSVCAFALFVGAIVCIEWCKHISGFYRR